MTNKIVLCEKCSGSGHTGYYECTDYYECTVYHECTYYHRRDYVTIYNVCKTCNGYGRLLEKTTLELFTCDETLKLQAKVT